MPPPFKVPAAHTLQQVLEDIAHRVYEALPIHQCYHYRLDVLVIQVGLASQLGGKVLAAPTVSQLGVSN